MELSSQKLGDIVGKLNEGAEGKKGEGPSSVGGLRMGRDDVQRERRDERHHLEAGYIVHIDPQNTVSRE